MNFFSLSIYWVFLIFTCELLLVNHVETATRTLSKMKPQDFVEWHDRCIGELYIPNICNKALEIGFQKNVFVDLQIAEKEKVEYLLDKMVSQNKLYDGLPKIIKETIPSVLKESHVGYSLDVHQLFLCLMKCMKAPFVCKSPILNPVYLYDLAEALKSVLKKLQNNVIVMLEINIDIKEILTKYGYGNRDAPKFKHIRLDHFDFVRTSELTMAVITGIENIAEGNLPAIKYLFGRFMPLLDLILKTRHNRNLVNALGKSNPDTPKAAQRMIQDLIQLACYLPKSLLKFRIAIGLEKSYAQTVGNLNQRVASTIDEYLKKFPWLKGN